MPIFCMYLVAAERQGFSHEQLDGTLQTDIFKEYIAQKEWIFPPEPHLRLIGDPAEYTDANMPPLQTAERVRVPHPGGRCDCRAGIAFTLADGFGYVELGQARGLDVDRFAPGLSFFFDAHIDFFEEIAKFRAARRIWARWLRDRCMERPARAPSGCASTQTAGSR